MNRMIASFLSIILLGSNAHADQTKELPTTSEIRLTVKNIAREIAAEFDLMLDPRLVERMTASVLSYSLNFCTNNEANCKDNLIPSPALREHIRKHIADINRVSNEPTQTLLDRLSGGQSSSIGWPSHAIEELGIVHFQDDRTNANVSIRFAVDSVHIGQWKPKMLSTAGELEVHIVNEAKKETITFRVEPFETISVSNNPTLETSSSARTIQILPSAYCQTAPTPAYTGPFSAFNWGRAKFGESIELRKKNESVILGAHVLDIDIQVDASIICKKSCRDSLTLLFADAVAAWKLGCERCDPNALVMIRTQASTWLDERLTRRLKMLNDGKKVSLRLQDPVESDQVTVGIYNPLLDLSKEPVAKKQLCMTSDSAANWVAPAKSVVCTQLKENSKNGVLNPRVRVLGKPGTCGPLAVACGLPDAGIEINASSYRFSTPSANGDSSLVIGKSSTAQVLSLRAVVLHEVGHWFGIPHAEIGASQSHLDIMSEVYGDGEACIAPQSLRMAANAGDLRWPYRVKQGGALKPPRSAKK